MYTRSMLNLLNAANIIHCVNCIYYNKHGERVIKSINNHYNCENIINYSECGDILILIYSRQTLLPTANHLTHFCHSIQLLEIMVEIFSLFIFSMCVRTCVCVFI